MKSSGEVRGNRSGVALDVVDGGVTPVHASPPNLRTEPDPQMSSIQNVQTDRAPAAIGPYSQAVVVDDWIYVSGQIPLDPETGEQERGAVADQTHRVFRNLEAVLEEAGGSLRTVVKTTVFLSDMGAFAEMNDVYAEYFGDHRPARSTVQAAGLPKGVDVEIDAVARVAR